MAANDLLTLDDLAVWTRTEIADDDDWAPTVVEAASEVVRMAAGQPGWTMLSAPPRARQIAAHLAARSYLNPESVVREGIGPLSEARAETLAQALHLTKTEQAELASMSPLALPGGLPGQSAGRGGVLWVQPLHTSTPLEGDIVIGNIAYGHPDDAYAFTPET